MKFKLPPLNLWNSTILKVFLLSVLFGSCVGTCEPQNPQANDGIPAALCILVLGCIVWIAAPIFLFIMRENEKNGW